MALFLMYINDIASTIEAQVHIRIFADGCLVYSTISSVEDQQRLNDALQDIKHRCDKWDMKTNYNKSVSYHITNKKKCFPLIIALGTPN